MNFLFSTIAVAGALFLLMLTFKNIGINMLLNTNALILILGGSLISLFIAFPANRLKDTVVDIFESFKNKRDKNELIKDIVDIAKIYRSANMRKLEEKTININDRFLRLGITLLLNHSKSNEIRDILEREASLRIAQYNLSQNIIRTVARLAPSLGLAGTVISLVSMFNNFQSVDSIAPMMSVALMSTFYGVIISNVFALPLSAKMKEKAILSEILMSITIEGIIAVYNMEHPLKIEDRLSGHSETVKVYHSEVKIPLTNSI
ncbi:MAG: MotA/TolQ/ExbB proton channel family protein [Nitrospirae bacterium]|jgi:chemotaxis protein MotA|nr:MotA/TolQ/ExbB proton channel family protein [Nitrospirota bacterium]